MRNGILIVLVFALFLPNMLLASEHGAHGIETLTWYYINSAIFFTALFFLLRKPCKQYFLSRKESIKVSIDDANEIYDDAKKALNEAKRKHEFLESELQKIRDEIIFEANEQAEHIVDVAQKKSEYLKSTAMQMIDAEEKKVLKNLNTEFGKILVDTTISDIKSSLDKELDKKLINNGIEKIKQADFN